MATRRTSTRKPKVKRVVAEVVEPTTKLAKTEPAPKPLVQIHRDGRAEVDLIGVLNFFFGQ